MRGRLLIAGCIIILIVISSGCVAFKGAKHSLNNESITTPFGKVIITNPTPTYPEKAPIFVVTGFNLSENEPTTETQKSGAWEGFPICFNATEEWSIQNIRNYSENAHVVTREYTYFANYSYCNITYVDVMGVGLGINRTPRQQEYASAIIDNNMWKGVPWVRTKSHTLNETGTVKVVPIRTILENLSLNQTIGEIDESPFPLVIHKIEFGYFHRYHSGKCDDIEIWEPAWILYGNTRNETPIQLWLWAADQQDIDILLTPPPPSSRIPGIFIHTGEGEHHWISPDTREFALFEEEIREILGDIAADCPCSSTPEEIQAVRDNQWAIEIVYPETVTIPYTMFNESYYFTLGNAIVLPGDSLVYNGGQDVCRWGMQYTRQNTSIIGEMARDYISSQKV